MLWLKTILLTLLVPGIAVFLVPYLIQKPAGFALIACAWLWVLAMLLILLGVAGFCWVSQAFVRFGKGTPAPFDPTKRFVSQGLYRFVRNPMYLGAITVILGESLLFASWRLLVYAAVVFLVLHLFIVTFEEKNLVARYGDEYLGYLRSVPRWIPRVPGK